MGLGEIEGADRSRLRAHHPAQTVDDVRKTNIFDQNTSTLRQYLIQLPICGLVDVIIIELNSGCYMSTVSLLTPHRLICKALSPQDNARWLVG